MYKWKIKCCHVNDATKVLNNILCLCVIFGVLVHRRLAEKLYVHVHLALEQVFTIKHLQKMSESIVSYILSRAKLNRLNPLNMFEAQKHVLLTIIHTRFYQMFSFTYMLRGQLHIQGFPCPVTTCSLTPETYWSSNILPDWLISLMGRDQADESSRY